MNRSMKKVQIWLEENHSLISDDELMMEEMMAEGDTETEEASLCLKVSCSREIIVAWPGVNQYASAKNR